MTDWQERIDRETPAAIQAEHQLRYRTVAPLLATSGAWADLGCGNGLAPARVLGGERPPRLVLVDLDPQAVATAAAELGAADAVQLSGDLTDADLLHRVGEALLAGEGPRLVTCFEVVEHLDTFVGLVDWATELCAAHDATCVLSVPNDALWAIENPFHATRWGEGAFEELRRLLPAEQTLLRQIALTGSSLVVAGETGAPFELSVDVEPDLPPSHFLAAFGPRHSEVLAGACAVAHDQRAQRRWERQRESNLAHSEARVDALTRDLREMMTEREQWRRYIHELERELGRPLSGSDAASVS